MAKNDDLILEGEVPDEEYAKIYNDALGGIEEIGKQQMAAIDQYKTDQQKIQNEATDIALRKLENEKDAVTHDYQKEQRAAYADYTKQTDPYGTNAEKMAAAGLTGSGYSESSKVRMYTAYQNRVAVARENYNRVIADYNIAMDEARNQNSSVLAQIAYNSMVSGLELAMNILTKKTDLLLEMADKNLLGYVNGGLNASTIEPAPLQVPQPQTGIINKNSAGGAINQYLQNEAKNPYESKVKATANRTALGQIYVDQYGWITWEKLLELVESGKVQEKKANGKFVYTPVQSK